MNKIRVVVSNLYSHDSQWPIRDVVVVVGVVVVVVVVAAAIYIVAFFIAMHSHAYNSPSHRTFTALSLSFLKDL